MPPAPTVPGRPKKRSALEARDPKATPMDLVSLVRAGLPWALYRGVMAELGLTDQMAAVVLRIPLRTLSRRKGGALTPRKVSTSFAWFV